MNEGKAVYLHKWRMGRLDDDSSIGVQYNTEEGIWYRSVYTTFSPPTADPRQVLLFHMVDLPSKCLIVLLEGRGRWSVELDKKLA